MKFKDIIKTWVAILCVLCLVSTIAQAQFTKIVLTWTAVSGATGYNAYRCTNPQLASSCVKLNSSPITTTTYTDQLSLINLTTYYYVATSLGSFPESPFGNVAAAYYGPPPTQQLMPAPAGLAAGPQ